MSRLVQRLQYMRHRPETVIDIGCGTGAAIGALQKRYPRAWIVAADVSLPMLQRARRRYRRWSRRAPVAADMEHLPFAESSFDLVFSSLALPWSDDPGAALAEFARVARPGALLMFSTLGPATLAELAAAWRMIDPGPHVHRFVDMHDVGDAMLAAGFAQPVVDAETIRLEYRDFRLLLSDLSGSGASNADLGRRRGLTAPGKLRALEAAYREQGFDDGKFVASYEVVYGHAWAPDGAR